MNKPLCGAELLAGYKRWQFLSSAILADTLNSKFLNSALVNDIQTTSPAHTVLQIFTSFIQMFHLQYSWFFCRLLYFLHLCWIVTERKYATLACIYLDVTLFTSFTICLYCYFLPVRIFFISYIFHFTISYSKISINLTYWVLSANFSKPTKH